MKRAIVTLLLLAVVGGSIFAYYTYRQTGPKFTVATATVTRGDVIDSVGATGTLQAVTTVQVGSQVSGTILELNADFNSLVRKGQVLARLDPSLFQTQIEQARANLIRAEADLERLKVSLEDSRTKLARATELAARQLIPKSELDTAGINVRVAEAQLRSSEAQVTQAQASLNQNEVNLQHTVIEAPIDGLVISRSVDVGQTVAASMQAPTLFLLAADLTKMQVLANLDESDVGRIRPGQNVTFRVDAYPGDSFTGRVSQVRLEPKVAQNVVTYATVIAVPNDQLKLKPGMTANVNVEIAKSSDVLLVPNAALRFRPTNDIYAAIGQTPPDPALLRAGMGGSGRRGGGQGGSAAAAPSNSPAPIAPKVATAPTDAQPRRGRAETPELAAPRGALSDGGQDEPSANGSNAASRGDSVGSGRGGRGASGRGGFGGGRGRSGGGTRGLEPDASAATGNSRGGAGTAAQGRGRGAPPAVSPAQMSARGGATTIDALFGPLARVESTGTAWLFVDQQLSPVRLRLGISDGQITELIEGDLREGQELVSNVTLTSAATRPAASPFPGFGGQPGRGGPGPGGGGNRGGGRGGGRGN